MGKTKAIIFPLLVGLSYSILAAYFQWDSFSISYSRQEYEQMYTASQYVLGENSIQRMGDGDIYTFAGIQYLQGTDPTSINFEHPPLAKLIYAVAYFLTGYPNIALVLFNTLLISSFWSLSGALFKQIHYRLIALILLLLHSTIFKEAGRTMLDLPQAAFLLATTATFVRFTKRPTNLAACGFGFVAGLLMLVKYPFPMVGIYLVLLFLWAVINRIHITKLTFAGITMIITYCLGYSSYFTAGHTLVDFAKFEWWRWKWYQGKVDNPKFLIFEVIFSGKYQKWWDNSKEFVYFPHWNLLWPITFIGYLCSWLNRTLDIKNPLFAYKIWILVAMAALALGAYEDRFLTPLIPGFILFGTRFAADILKKWDNSK